MASVSINRSCEGAPGAAEVSNSGDRQPLNGLSLRLKSASVQLAEALHSCITREYATNRSGIMRKEMADTFGGFLIKDPLTFSFRDFHRLRSDLEHSAVQFTRSSMSIHDFECFLRTEAPGFIERYKEGKWRGFGSCGPIASDAEKSLNRVAPPDCAAIEGISHHAFNMVLVDRKPYMLDFTFDQFLDYDRIRNWRDRIAEDVAFSGVLLVPMDRMRLSFDKNGRLLAPL